MILLALLVAHISVDPSHVLNRISKDMYGACIEDVNHEIYGGLYGQRIFGESFEEPSTTTGPAGWRTLGGGWSSNGTEISGTAGDGPKLLLDRPTPGDGTVEVSVRFSERQGGNAGLLVRTSKAGSGADNFDGYEISVNPTAQRLILGKHRHDFKPLAEAPIPALAPDWQLLEVRLDGPRIQIYLNGSADPLIVFTDRDRPLLSGQIALRTWQTPARFKDLRVMGKPISLALVDDGVSGMWDKVGAGTFHLAGQAYNGARCQEVVHGAGHRLVGVANRGLNRWGISVRKGETMDGRVYLHGTLKSAIVALQSVDGSRTYAAARLAVGPNWAKRPFRLKPNATDPNARFAVLTDRPGSLWIDQAVLIGQDRFGGLPIRGDIARALKRERITFLRYGGTMVNVPGYRWKNMIGDPDRRPPYTGNWYPYSTNGFGIFDFLNFCEAAKVDAAFAINCEETPQDAADLADYLTAPANTKWGRRRAIDGHPAPYHPKYIEIGNEEAIGHVDADSAAHYAQRLRLVADAIHRRNPNLKLVSAGWWEPKSEAAMKTMFDAADGRAIAWDLHFWSDDADAGKSIGQELDRAQRLFKTWNPKTKLKVVVFEENGNRHDLQRALGHATTVTATRSRGDFVLADSAANCLQPWLQNDNGWDQGGVFFTSDHSWLMPPAHAQAILAKDAEPLRVEASSTGGLNVLASRSLDGKTLVLTVVNTSPKPVASTFSLGRFRPKLGRAVILCGRLTAVNPPAGGKEVEPKTVRFDPRRNFVFPAHSLTSIRLEVGRKLSA